MKISSWEEKQKHLLSLDKAYHWPIENFNKRKEKIDFIYKEFPFVVTVEASWEDFYEKDFLVWKLFGPRNGKCNYDSDDNNCPCDIAYKNIEHNHYGVWDYVPIAKTGYDYGFGSYCFKNEEDKNKFIEEMKL